MRFLWAFLAWLALLTSVLLIAVTVVNPRREFSGAKFPALQLNTRQMKADRFDSVLVKSPPTGVIIGSSRSMNLSPSDFESVTGERFFNFGVFGASIEDDLSIGRYVLATDRNVRSFVVGIDPQSFDSHLEPLAELRHNVRLSTARDGTIGNRWQSALITARAYRDALTVAYLMDVIKSARSAAHPPEASYAFDSLGVLHYPKADRERGSRTYDFKRHFTDCSAPQTTQFASYDSLGASKRAMLDSLIAEATAKGVRVILWTPPLNPGLSAAVRKDSTSGANYDRALTYIHSLARPPIVVTVDNNDTSRLPNPDGWYDCMHFDSSNARTVSHLLANAVRDANANANAAGVATAR